VYENCLLRKIFGPKRDEVIGDWRKPHNDELHNLFSLPSIIKVIESRRMRLVGHVARMTPKQNLYSLSMRKAKGRDNYEHLDIDGRIILKRILDRMR
jgi:ribosomal protein L34